MVDLLLTIDHLGEVTSGVTLVDLAGTHDLVLWVLNELIPMREPSCETGESEHDGEHLSGDSEGLVDDTGVEIDVGVELSLDKELVAQGNSLELHSNVDHGLTADNREDIISKLPHKSGSWVEVLIDTMSESHQHLLAVLNVLNELGNVLNITNLVEHAEHSLVGTTVTGAVESSDGTSERGVDIGLRRGHVADGSSRAVELVLGVKDEKNIDGLDNLGVRAVVGIGGSGIHHVEEVLSVAELLLGWDDGLADSVTVASSSDGWSASHDSVDMLVTLLAGLVDVGTDVGRVGLGVEGAHGSHKSRHHSHWVSVVTESLDERLETVMVRGVLHDLLCEGSELFGGGELSVDEKEGSLKEVGVLSELLDGVSTVLKDSLLTVNEGNTRDAVDGVHVSWIIRTGHGTGWALNLREVGRVDGAILDGELVVFA